MRIPTIRHLTVVASLAALAACASTNSTTESADNGKMRTVPTVTPDTNSDKSTRREGPTPGSTEDLRQAGHRVFFGYDQYRLTPDAQDTLARQAAWLKQYPGARIRIEGNTDERGTREYNFALGARRANAVKAFLIDRGVDPSRITVLSLGKERPIDGRSTPEAWSLNRNSTTVLLTTVSS